MKNLGIFTLLCTLFFSRIAFADDGNCFCPFEGFYTGLSAGASISTGQTQIIRRSFFHFPNIGFQVEGRTESHAHLKKHSFTGNIYAGYGFNWDPGYMGLEIFGKGFRSRSRLHETDSVLFTLPGNITRGAEVNAETRLKLHTGEYGLDIRPGVMITRDSMLYARFGFAINKYTLNTFNHFTVKNSGITIPFDFERNKRVAAFRIGAGLEQYFCECWTIRADYIYTNYRRLDINKISLIRFSSPATGITNTILSNTTNAKIHNHGITLGISYYW